MKLKNINSLITGGSQGLGKTIASISCVKEGTSLFVPAAKWICRPRVTNSPENFPHKKFPPKLVTFPTKRR